MRCECQQRPTWVGDLSAKAREPTNEAGADTADIAHYTRRLKRVVEQGRTQRQGQAVDSRRLAVEVGRVILRTERGAEGQAAFWCGGRSGIVEYGEQLVGVDGRG